MAPERNEETEERAPLLRVFGGLAPPDELAAHGVVVVQSDRGGDVTYHAPGQLVGYPIVDLQALRPDLHWYLRALANFNPTLRELDRLRVPVKMPSLMKEPQFEAWPTPTVWPASGWPGVAEPHWRNALRSSSDRS